MLSNTNYTNSINLVKYSWYVSHANSANAKYAHSNYAKHVNYAN